MSALEFASQHPASATILGVVAMLCTTFVIALLVGVDVSVERRKP